MSFPDRYSQLATRFDAGESVVIARSLDHVEQKITEVMYAELRALKLVPTIPGIDPGAKTYTFMVMDRVGQAEPSSERGKDLPRADVFLTENTSGIKSYGAQYGYTTQELREIAMAASRGVNIQLDVARAESAAKMIARKIDNVVAFGDPIDTRIKGFLNNASVTVDAAVGTWSGLTPEQLLAELYALANQQVIVSKEIFSPDVILLPTTQHLLVGTTPYGTAGLKTVLQFFNEAMANMGRQVSVESWPLLSTADAGRTGPRAVAYKRSVDVAGAVVPLAFQSQPPQAQGLEWLIPCEGVCGGAAVKQPLGMYYRDGL
jgi:hypothetical protein